MGRLIWLLEKARGVRVSADSDDAHGMVALAKTHEYERPSDQPQCEKDFAAAEARRSAEAEKARAAAAQAAQNATDGVFSAPAAQDEGAGLESDHGAQDTSSELGHGG